MTVIVRLKGEEARRELEAQLEAASAAYDQANRDFNEFVVAKQYGDSTLRTQARNAGTRFKSLTAQLALFDRYPQQAEFILEA